MSYDRRRTSRNSGGPLANEKLVCKRVFRIGVQQLSRVDDQYYVAIKNRTYYSKHPISHESATRWHKVLERKV